MFDISHFVKIANSRIGMDVMKNFFLPHNHFKSFNYWFHSWKKKSSPEIWSSHATRNIVKINTHANSSLCTHAKMSWMQPHSFFVYVCFCCSIYKQNTAKMLTRKSKQTMNKFELSTRGKALYFSTVAILAMFDVKITLDERLCAFFCWCCCCCGPQSIVFFIVQINHYKNINS